MIIVFIRINSLHGKTCQVDLALFGHVHNYERTCAVYQKECKALPTKDASGIDTYDNSKYTAPVHATVRAGGFSLDKFPRIVVRTIVTSLL